VLRFRELNLPRFDLAGALDAKPARPIKVHVRAKTLLPQTLGRPAEEPTVQTNSDSSRPPPPERSTPRLGGPRPPVSSPNVHIAERPPPPERSTPRLGAVRVEPDPAAPDAGAQDDADTTVLTDRRKQQLVESANEQPDESLYDIVGANTHRNLQVAADENSRRAWAAAVAAQKRVPRVSTTTPDTRWIPGALFVAGGLVLGLGVWIWQGKLHPPEVSLGALPATTLAAASNESGTTASAASPGEPAHSQARAEPAPPQVETAPLAAAEVRDAAAAPTSASEPTKEAPSSAAPAPQVSSRPTVTATATAAAAAPARSKKSSEQSIFTDAPF
jgi:hypothetical protein